MAEAHTIRPMTEDDLPAVLAIDGAVGWRHDEERFHYLLAAPDTRGAIAEDDGAVGGFAFMGLREPVGWLGPVAIDPARQGRGLGTALVREADRFFREEERCDAAILEARVDNRRAIELYDRIGFVVTGVAELFGTPEGAAPTVPPPAPDDDATDDDARWITPLTEDDLPFLAALDDSYYGGWREDDLLYWLGAGLDRAPPAARRRADRLLLGRGRDRATRPRRRPEPPRLPGPPRRDPPHDAARRGRTDPCGQPAPRRSDPGGGRRAGRAQARLVARPPQRPHGESLPPPRTPHGRHLRFGEVGEGVSRS